MELVQLLALHDGRTVVRDRVIDALWPHLDPEAGGANLRKAAHHARQALGDADALVLRGGRVSLFPGKQVHVDAWNFEARADAALARRDPEECGTVAESYGDGLLPGALYEDWADAPRRRLRMRYLELLRASGRWVELLEAEPIDEHAVRELMKAALRAGRRPTAIRWYGRLRATLERELGVRPSEETERLYDECVAGLETSSPALVGRRLELARVTDLLRNVPERIRAIAVKGPPGIGKSSFVREAVRLAAAERWFVAEADAARRRHPYDPLVGLIERLLEQRPSLHEAVGGSLPVLAALTSPIGDAVPLDGPPTRHQVLGALRRLLLAAAEGEPVLLVLDDADAADEATIETMAQLALSPGPLTVVLAYRAATGSEALERSLTQLTRVERLSTIDLGPLSVEESADLVSRAAGWELDPELTQQIVALGEGNPFATIELARSVDPDHPQLLPGSVSSAITARLVDLDTDTVEVLQRIALVSGDLDSASVVALTGDTETAAWRVLDLALAVGVLVVADGRYRFRHDLVRQALIDQVAPHQRLAVHRDAARRLARAGAPPAAVARHWLDGGRPEDAVEWLLLAAREAMALGAFRDALQHLAPLLAHEPSHGAALRVRAEALDMLGDPATLPAYDAAIAEASEADAHDLRAMRALAQLKQGDPPGALRAIEGVTPTSIQGRLSEALTYSGAAALGYADPALGTAKAAESRRLALESGDTAAIVVASWAQAAAAHARGELRDSVLADLCDTRDLPHLAVRVFDGQLCITQRFLYGSRPYPDVIDFADRLSAEARRMGAARGEAFGVTLRGEAELLSGRLNEAEADLMQGARLHASIGGATGQALALQRLAELALHRGDRRRAAGLLEEALDLARETDIGFHLLDRIYGTRIAVADDPADALRATMEAELAVRGPLETCPGCRITFAAPAAIAAAKAGDLDRATEYEKSTTWLAEVVMRLPAWYAALDEVRGQVALASGDRAAALSLFAAAAERFCAAGHPLDEARCRALARESS